MEYGKFILAGEDKKSLATIKNALVSSGHIYIGYSKEPVNILRHIRNQAPDMVIIEVNNNFGELRPVLEVIDEEILCACILVLESRNDAVFNFLRDSRVMTYITKPVFEEVMVQIADIVLMNYRRVLDYETKVRKLNETLESRKTVEKAKWILIEQQGLSESEAYEVIKKKSRDNRMPMREIAEAIILTRG